MERQQLTLRIDAEVGERLFKEAERKSIPVGELITLILYQHYQNAVPE